VSKLIRKGRLRPAKREAVLFTSSSRDDKRILKQIVDVNKAHVLMLVERKIISKFDGAGILKSLEGLEDRIELRPEHEDAHVAIEEEVIKAVGEDAGGNINLAKSRNDQVATAIRMKLREEMLEIAEAIINLQETLLKKAEETLGTIIPGYTHLQPAQPITFSHYLLAQFDAFERSFSRLCEAYKRVNFCPMGAGALATTSFPIDRERVAELLGFSGVLENSLDAVSSRDFLLETLGVFSIMAVDAARIAEDLIVWSSIEFGMVELPDEYAFTSSIMPQKKNPDVLEVLRARMSNIIGTFVASATMLKALPTGYNLDFQEATPHLWNASETMQRCLGILSNVILNINVRSTALFKDELSFLAATEVANMLVQKYNVPFRTAHRIVGMAVKNLLEKDRSFIDITPEILTEATKAATGSPITVNKEDLEHALDLSRCVEAQAVRGGPSRRENERMIRERWRLLDDSRKWLCERRSRLDEAERLLDEEVRKLLKDSPEKRNV